MIRCIISDLIRNYVHFSFFSFLFIFNDENSNISKSYDKEQKKEERKKEKKKLCLISILKQQQKKNCDTLYLFPYN